MANEKEGATPTLMPRLALRPTICPNPVASDCERALLRPSAWLRVVALLVVSETELVSEPEVVQASERVVEWLLACVLARLAALLDDCVWELLWVVDWLLVKDSLAVSECMLVSAVPLLEVTPSATPQPM